VGASLVANKESVPLNGDAAGLFRRVKLLSSLQVGHEPIDDDHRRLFDMVNRIIESIEQKADPGTNLAAFMGALESHFQWEENFLQEIDYPRTEEHAAYHQELLARAGQIQRQYKKGAGDRGKELIDDLISLVLADILMGDLKFKSFLIEKKLSKEE
jgi:hemerythrin-like metal-binding protein